MDERIGKPNNWNHPNAQHLHPEESDRVIIRIGVALDFHRKASVNICTINKWEINWNISEINGEKIYRKSTENLLRPILNGMDF